MMFFDPRQSGTYQQFGYDFYKQQISYAIIFLTQITIKKLIK